MSVGNAVFHVLTEFRFEAQSAIAETQALKGAVSEVSIAADNAIMSLVSMGKSFMSMFGLQGGIAGIFAMGIKSSEAFSKSSLQIDAGQLPEGFYLVKVTTSIGQEVYKMLKI